MDAATATALMSALGQPTRLMAVRRLLSAWPGTLPAGVLARACRTGPSTFSRHLAILARTGVVQLERAGTTVHCRADAGRLRALLAYLSRDCCRDRSELCGAFAGIADLDEAGAHLPARQPARAAAPSRGPVPALNVLFLGSRNAARTILAEALLRRLGGARFNAYSAGARPARQPMPEVLGRLRRLGCDLDALRCKPVETFLARDAPRIDVVLVLGEPGRGGSWQGIDAVFGPPTVIAAWPLPDPTGYRGSAAERAVLIGELVNMLQRRLEALVDLPFASLDQPTLTRRLAEAGGPVEP